MLGHVRAGQARSIGEQNSASSCVRAAASGFPARSPGLTKMNDNAALPRGYFGLKKPGNLLGPESRIRTIT